MNRRILIVVALASALLLAMISTTGAQGPVPGGLVLWNRLGSEEEVLHSAFGPGFGTREGVLYVDGEYGGALATTGGENGGGGYLTMSPDDFFPADKTQGTVEAWFQKRTDVFIPFESPLVGVFGWQPYGDFPTRSYQAIIAYWTDGFTGWGGLEFTITESDQVWHRANDLGWDDVPVGQWVHVAFVWDLAGIDGTQDRMRIYRDGVLVGTNSDPIPGIREDTAEVRILGHHAYSRFGQPTLYLDNLKVWDYAKTDFSDRFYEGFPPVEVEVEIDVKPGSHPNSINLGSRGVVPVAVWTTDEFDATTIDPGTVKFASASPDKWTEQDVDGDGDLDLVLHFRTQSLDLEPGSTEAELTGVTSDGTCIRGTDTVNIVPHNKTR
ncbi:MAG TPA: LamG-like jellyroll fold domain-containing protein [Anaerolineae bacterium]|nr:LamG-like jellyroll fold domain-containing protein [Anaerolineae bacterium]